MYYFWNYYCVHNFSFLKKLKHLITALFHHFHLFQHGLIDLWTPKGCHFIKKRFFLDKMLNLGFRNFRPIFLKSEPFYKGQLYKNCSFLGVVLLPPSQIPQLFLGTKHLFGNTSLYSDSSQYAIIIFQSLIGLF